jgi:hypothetical protein
MRDVVDERPHVDVVEIGPPRVEPAAELADVDAVRATGAVGERRRVEKACGGRVAVHNEAFDASLPQPAQDRAVLLG